MARRGDRDRDDHGQVIEAGGGDLLLVNGVGDIDQDGPAGILIRAQEVRLLPPGLGENAWQTALELVERKKAKLFPVKTLAALSSGVTAITLLLDPPHGNPIARTAAKKAPKARAKGKAKAKGKKR
jgi:hypothetical protein